jgi:hypothetical protein
VSGGFPAGEWFYVYVVLSALPPRDPTWHSIVAELPGRSQSLRCPLTEPLSSRMGLALSWWMQQRGSRRRTPPVPLQQLRYRLLGPSMATVLFDRRMLTTQILCIWSVLRTSGALLGRPLSTSLGLPSETLLFLNSLSPLEGEHPPSGSLSREPLTGKIPWGFIPRRDPTPALHTRDKDHDYRYSWVQPSHFCKGGGMGLFFYVPPGGVFRSEWRVFQS